MRSAKKQQGFTLIELMVSVVLMLILVGAVVTVFTHSSKVFTISEAKMNVYQNARAALALMARELASVDNSGNDFVLRNASGTADTEIMKFKTTTSWMTTSGRQSGGAEVRYILQQTKNKKLWNIVRQVWSTEATPSQLDSSILAQFVEIYNSDTSGTEVNKPDILVEYFQFSSGNWVITRAADGSGTGAGATGGYEFDNTNAAKSTPPAVRVTMNLTDLQRRVTRTVSRTMWIATASN